MRLDDDDDEFGVGGGWVAAGAEDPGRRGQRSGAGGAGVLRPGD